MAAEKNNRPNALYCPFCLVNKRAIELVEASSNENDSDKHQEFQYDILIFYKCPECGYGEEFIDN